MNYHAEARKAKDQAKKDRIGNVFLFHVPELDNPNRMVCGTVSEEIVRGDFDGLVAAIKSEHMRILENYHAAV